MSSWVERAREAEIEPSLYAADFARLGEQIDALLAAGCRVFHFDVGDGHFVEPVTIGPIVLASISRRIHDGGGAIDVHLMVERPAQHFGAVAEAGGDGVTFHFEAVDDVEATARAARGAGLAAGIAFNPETEPEAVAEVAGGLDLVLCMAIHPGYSGQAFRPETIDRVQRLAAALPDGMRIQVDGGVGAANVREIRDAGATLLVAGSAIFAHDDPAEAYGELARAVS
jgi:ribulose-phosphate 3-epimerase